MSNEEMRSAMKNLQDSLIVMAHIEKQQFRRYRLIQNVQELPITGIM